MSLASLKSIFLEGSNGAISDLDLSGGDGFKHLSRCLTFMEAEDLEQFRPLIRSSFAKRLEEIDFLNLTEQDVQFFDLINFSKIPIESLVKDFVQPIVDRSTRSLYDQSSIRSPAVTEHLNGNGSVAEDVSTGSHSAVVFKYQPPVQVPPDKVEQEIMVDQQISSAENDSLPPQPVAPVDKERDETGPPPSESEARPHVSNTSSIGEQAVAVAEQVVVEKKPPEVVQPCSSGWQPSSDDRIRDMAAGPKKCRQMSAEEKVKNWMFETTEAAAESAGEVADSRSPSPSPRAPYLPPLPLFSSIKRKMFENHDVFRALVCRFVRPDDFFVFEFGKRKKRSKFIENFNKYCDAKKVDDYVTLTVDDMGKDFAHFDEMNDEKWYRVRVEWLEYDENNGDVVCQLYCHDFGYVLKYVSPSSKFLKIEDGEFLDTPAFAIRCVLSGVGAPAPIDDYRPADLSKIKELFFPTYDEADQDYNREDVLTVTVDSLVKDSFHIVRLEHAVTGDVAESLLSRRLAGKASVNDTRALVTSLYNKVIETAHLNMSKVRNYEKLTHDSDPPKKPQFDAVDLLHAMFEEGMAAKPPPPPPPPPLQQRPVARVAATTAPAPKSIDKRCFLSEYNAINFDASIDEAPLQREIDEDSLKVIEITEVIDENRFYFVLRDEHDASLRCLIGSELAARRVHSLSPPESINVGMFLIALRPPVSKMERCRAVVIAVEGEMVDIFDIDGGEKMRIEKSNVVHRYTPEELQKEPFGLALLGKAVASCSAGEITKNRYAAGLESTLQLAFDSIRSCRLGEDPIPLILDSINFTNSSSDEVSADFHSAIAESASSVSRLIPQQVAPQPQQLVEVDDSAFQPCTHFFNSSCKYGDRCRFSHDPRLLKPTSDLKLFKPA